MIHKQTSLNHIHFGGICGTAMGSLAVLLKKRGYHITGSDQNVYPPMSDFLREHSIQVREGFSLANLEPQPDLLSWAMRSRVVTQKLRRPWHNVFLIFQWQNC